MDEFMLVERDAVRAIILTPANEVLLLRIRPPDDQEPFWITPGGGRETGEAVEAALKRELQEELSLNEYRVGPLVWRRLHTFNWAGKRVRQNERYYIVHTDRFEPRMSDPLEAKLLDRFRWWPVTELANSTERLTPLSLAEIVARYLAEGAPEGPLEIEVLVD
jgi:8-oxo-dGTP pyrophosphatase MutT (NUDIX family)